MNGTLSQTSLQRVAAKALPALSGSAVTYNAEKNVYLTTGYTSQAGNTYFKAIRLSDRLAVYYDLGMGYSASFLNGITLFAFQGTNPVMIGHRTYSCFFFNEEDAARESISMLAAFLQGQAKLMGSSFSERQVLDYAGTLIEETRRKRIAQ